MENSEHQMGEIRKLQEKEKEHCALTVMRRMLEKYADKREISFEEAFYQFTNSYVYRELFDYDTNVWSEGPDYLMDLFESAMEGKHQSPS